MMKVGFFNRQRQNEFWDYELAKQVTGQAVRIFDPWRWIVSHDSINWELISNSKALDSLRFLFEYLVFF
jgi:hypothetical protein